jgi:predicted dinucleotide-binding enzyme
MKGLTVGLTTSAAENVAAWAKGARVVKCFNITGAQIMANPTFGSDHATMFLAGDDAEAKKVAGMLVETLEFEVCDTGPL